MFTHEFDISRDANEQNIGSSFSGLSSEQGLRLNRDLLVLIAIYKGVSRVDTPDHEFSSISCYACAQSGDRDIACLFSPFHVHNGTLTFSMHFDRFLTRNVPQPSLSYQTRILSDLHHFPNH
jgi:hypothetical protein